MKIDDQGWGLSAAGDRALAQAINPNPARDSIAGALAAAQLEMKNPVFDAANPHFRNRFASLAAVRNAVIPVLAKHGISLVQDLTTVEGGIACRTFLTHSSGQQMAFGPLVLPPTKADAQGFGSAATYCRRYSMMAVAGVVGDDDDDGNGAAQSNRDHADDASKQKAEAKKYADLLADAHASGIEGRVVDLHKELATNEALYRVSFALLPANIRASIKEIVARNK